VLLRIYICEDEDAQREKIKACVANYILAEDYDAEITLAAASPDELLRAVSGGKDTGLYFLDVDLRSEINGIKLAEAIRKHDPRAYIVFVTTHGEALPLTFKYKVEALDYIVKDDMETIGPRIAACVKDAYAKHTSASGSGQNYVFKMTEQRLVSVPFASIIYIETAPRVPRKVILHSVDGLYEYYGKLDEILGQLDRRFYRCHKSFIVNIRAIEMVDRKSGVVKLKGGGSCLASTRKLNELTRRIIECQNR
jgi:two-component system response regulator AgrA